MMADDIIIEGILSADGTFRQTNGASFDRWLAAHDAAVRADMQREVQTVERRYCRAVSGFGWPQGYPQPCGPDDNPTHYRDDPTGPWLPVTPSTPNQQGEETL